MTERTVLKLGIAALALTAAACAGTPREGGRPTYGQEMERLRADCAARGGILTPIPGATTGRPQTDNACEIRGGASRLPR